MEWILGSTGKEMKVDSLRLIHPTSKSEIRSTKHETNPKFEFSNVQNKSHQHSIRKFRSFEFWSFEFVSKLGTRPKGGESGGPISIF
jgi:hypothetical protein